MIGVFQWDDLLFAPVFKLPQAKAREFYLESTVHETRARLQVPVKSQVTFVNELHSLKTEVLNLYSANDPIQYYNGELLMYVTWNNMT